MTRRFTEQLADIIWNEVDQQTDIRLQEIIAECESQTRTNCGWVAWRLGNLVIAIVRAVEAGRKEKSDG